MAKFFALLQNSFFEQFDVFRQQNELVFAIALVIVFAIAARIVLFVLKKYAHSIALKTKTDLDDLIVQIITFPLYVIIISAGIFIALLSLSFLEQFTPLIINTFFVGWVFVGAWTVSRVMVLVIGRALKVQKKFEKTPKLINRMIKVVIYLVGVLIILAYFNVEITPIIAALGLGGLAVGLALQPTLSNFFAGIQILSDKPINVGDFIEVEGSVGGQNISGFVEDISWRSTRIRTLSNTIVIVPNARLADSIIVNDSLPQQEMAALVQCGVDYGSDLKKVEKVTIEVAKKIQETVPGAVKGFEPFIRFHTFGDSNINFTVILRVEKIVDKHLVIHEFIKSLKEKYGKEKIEISWPVRKLYNAK